MKAAIYRALQLPLLTIELKQMAAAKRTYVVRFAYAATLFGVAGWLFFYTAASDTKVFGRGLELFLNLMWIQFFGLCLIVPATTCGVIAEEKGRNTLGVLLLSPLGGFRIVSQKLLSRLVPMFSFVLLSLPLLAVAYSYGGVTNAQLFMGIVLLLLSCAQIGAISILMSVLCRTTVTALMSTYAVFLLTLFSCVLFWPIHFVSSEELTGAPIAMSVLISGGCILAASFSLVSRAFQNTHNYLLQFQREVDRFVADANRLVGDIELFKEPDNKPQFNPVRWRETDRRALGRTRYLLRILFAVELPLIFIASMVTGPAFPAVHSVMRGLLWLGSLILLSAYGASLIAGERSRGTLDVLLTTPLTGRSILIEKSSGLRRLFIVLAVPLITLPVIEYVRAPVSPDGLNVLVQNFIWSVVSVIVWLQVVSWFALWASTRVKTQTSASFLVMSTVGGILLVPLLVMTIVKTGGGSDSIVNLFALVSPTHILATLSPFTKSYYGLPAIPTWILLVHFGILGAMIIVFRKLALRDIDVTLGRIPEGFVLDKSQAPPEAHEPSTSG